MNHNNKEIDNINKLFILYKMSKKLHCVLDIDLTLISAEPSEEFDFEKYKEKVVNNFDFEDMDSYYIIVARPYLQEFLDYLFKNFKVSIFTAASRSYALFIINKFILKDKSRKLEYIFFDYHCKLSEHKYDAQKDLRLFWEEFKLPEFNPNTTFLIDDYCHNKKTQPCNCIQIKKFEVTDKNSENDTELRDMIPKLKKLKKVMENPPSGDICLVE